MTLTFFRSTARIAALGLALSLLAACGSSKAKIEATTPDSVIAGVDKGDDVIITSKNGKRYHFVVTKMTNKALYGDGYRVTYDEMAQVKIEAKSQLKKSASDKPETEGEEKKKGFFSRWF